MFVHFGPNTYQGREADNGSTPLAAIDPKRLDTDQWARIAVSLGASYIVIVAKHGGGFCLWQTDTTSYSIKHTPWRGGRGDIVADLAASCRRFGLKLGAYVCPHDDQFGAKTGGLCDSPEAQARYDAVFRQQLTEVWTRYGPLCEIWFDGSTATPVADLIARYQPNAAVFQGPAANIRWVGNEDGFAPYPCWNAIAAEAAKSGTATALDSDQNGDAWMPCEADVSIRRPDWFWKSGGDRTLLDQDALMSIYYRSVGRGVQLLLNVAPDRDGLVPEKDTEVARMFGNALRRRFAQPVAETSGMGSALHMTLVPRSRIDTVVLQEDISQGERVRAYRLDAHVDGRWREVARGSAIGQKRIQPVEPMRADGFRLVILEAVAAPMLSRMALFDTGTPPPADWNQPSPIWSADTVGRWQNGGFAVDLTSKIKAAAQYLMRFVPDEGRVSGLADVVLMLNGVPKQDMLKPIPGKPDQLAISLTGIETAVRLIGRIEGADKGTIILRRRL